MLFNQSPILPVHFESFEEAAVLEVGPPPAHSDAHIWILVELI